jgi:plasmid stabilization system protein ParE
MIVFRKRFTSKLSKLYLYLKNEFGETTANQFLEKVHKAALAAETYPDAGKMTKVAGVRSKLIIPYTRLYYAKRGS